jgi:hypothetical protein
LGQGVSYRAAPDRGALDRSTARAFELDARFSVTNRPPETPIYFSETRAIFEAREQKSGLLV